MKPSDFTIGQRWRELRALIANGRVWIEPMPPSALDSIEALRAARLNAKVSK